MTSIYGQTIKLFGSHPEPAFESEAGQTDVWGRQWGCDNDVGTLRVCLMHRPGPEMEIGSFGDLDSGWYFQSDTVPDWEEFRAQHDGLVRTLQNEGVEVVFLDSIEPDGLKSIYTRDSSVAIKGGSVICRLARSIRRGEEAHVTRTIAGLGMPVLRTIHGTGMVEGGSFAWLNHRTAVIGRSICVNEEGARQLEEVLAWQGVELLRVDLTGYSIHIDGAMTMIDVDVAIIDPDMLPYPFLEKLKELGIRTVEITAQDNHAIINCLAVRPGRVIMPRGISNQTADTLASMNIETTEIDYDKVYLNGGGIHCSTCPLVRDSVH